MGVVRVGLTVKVAGVDCGVMGVIGDTVSAVVRAGGVERVVTVDIVGFGVHVGSATSLRTYTYALRGLSPEHSMELLSLHPPFLSFIQRLDWPYLSYVHSALVPLQHSP